jgi:hypothetical protein
MDRRHASIAEGQRGPPTDHRQTTAFASATSAAGSSEVGKYLLFGYALSFHLPTRAAREADEDAPLHLIE